MRSNVWRQRQAAFPSSPSRSRQTPRPEDACRRAGRQPGPSAWHPRRQPQSPGPGGLPQLGDSCSSWRSRLKYRTADLKAARVSLKTGPWFIRKTLDGSDGLEEQPGGTRTPVKFGLKKQNRPQAMHPGLVSLLQLRAVLCRASQGRQAQRSTAGDRRAGSVRPGPGAAARTGFLCGDGEGGWGTPGFWRPPSPTTTGWR